MPPERQVVLLTGASSGVGWETALLLAKEGYDLCLTARNQAALEKLAALVREQGGRCLVVPGDVTRQEDVERVVQGCLGEFGKIDVLVNNAAVQAYACFEDLSWEEIEHVNDVNYFGYLRFARAVLPQMRKRKSGVIVNILSVFEQAGLQFFSAYSASKHALLGWSKCLVLELAGTGVDVSTVVFPALNTPIYDHSLNRIGSEAKPPPPIYDVSVASKTILKAIRLRLLREVPVFIQGKFVMWLDFAAPWFGKALMSVVGVRIQKRKTPAPPTDGNFWNALPETPGSRGSLPATPAWIRYLPLLLLAVPAGAAAAFTLRKREELPPSRKEQAA